MGAVGWKGSTCLSQGHAVILRNTGYPVFVAHPAPVILSGNLFYIISVT